MATLDLCTELWGAVDIRDGDPAVHVISDGFYLPYEYGRAWGLFGNDGRSIPVAIDYREGIHLPPDQHATTPLTANTISATAPDGVYIYGGRINPHFGHFLVNTLPRFWAMSRIRSPSTKILCHGSGTPEGWFGIPFIAAAFGMLGLSPCDFVNFDEPMRLRRVVVPATSLEEQRAGYEVYGTLCGAIGDRIRAASSVPLNNRPIYYSKSRLSSAVGIITNEGEIEAVLRRAGVEIIYPEMLSFFEQIRLMSSRGRILGTAGSFLHTSIFCPGRQITCLNVQERLNSNFALIDALAGNTATYYYPPALQVLEQRAGFITSRYLPEAAAVAEALLARMHAG